jgi:hypothetical protein
MYVYKGYPVGFKHEQMSRFQNLCGMKRTSCTILFFAHQMGLEVQLNMYTCTMTVCSETRLSSSENCKSKDFWQIPKNNTKTRIVLIHK